MQDTIDQKLFSEACYKMIGALQGQNGIGTLREKTIHSVLKYYYAPDPVYHEIKIGSYVADICVVVGGFLMVFYVLLLWDKDKESGHGKA